MVLRNWAQVFQKLLVKGETIPLCRTYSMSEVDSNSVHTLLSLFGSSSSTDSGTTG